MDFFLQHVHRHIALFLGHGGFLLRFGQRFLVHFLILIQRNSLNLHRHGRNHIRRFLVHNEVVQCFDVYLLVADDIGCDKLASTFLVEGLHRSILDARELTNDSLHFGQLDTETANLHLTVTATHELDVAVRQITHYITCPVAATKWRLHESLCSLLGTIQITSSHLRTIDPQLTRRTHG